MRLVVQHFAGCPNWEIMRGHLATLIAEGLDAIVEYESIESHDEALERDFRGSPTVLVDGVDPFSDPTARPGLTCRVYDTEHGLAGSPTLSQLRTAITAAEGTSQW
jgi:hypothetical protein